MPIEVTMPRLSDTMERGTVVTWHVSEGDEVSPGQVIADIETDKATMELENFDVGTVAKIVAGEGDEVSVGGLIAVIAEEDEDPAEAAKAAESGAAAGAAKGGAKKEHAVGGGDSSSSSEDVESGTAIAEAISAAAMVSNGEASTAGEARGGRIFASPLARKIARERGVDLRSISGSGPSGRIIRRDVEEATGAAAAPEAAPEKAAQAAEPAAGPAAQQAPLPAVGAALEEKAVPLSNMRATIAKRLVESKQTIPHYQVTVSARLDNLVALRKQLNSQLESQGVKLSVNDFLVRACALAMHEHPHVNSSWSEKGGNGGPAIQLHGRVNIGVAVALPEERGGGLVVATLRDSDRQGLRQISAETKRLAKKAREKGLTVDEMSDSTFTISNLGMFGVDHFTAIINPPNAAILAVGRAIEKVFVSRDEDGEEQFEVGTEMAMTMSSDHRIVDGAMAAKYLGTVKQLLENPATLLV